MSKPIKIHPFDMYAMLTNPHLDEIMDIYKNADGTLTIGEQIFEQTCEVAPLSAVGKQMLEKMQLSGCTCARRRALTERG